jgi:hypothetical protein
MSVYLLICVTGYRFGPWRSYRYETGVIRTRKESGKRTQGDKFSEKRPVAELLKKIIKPPMLFYGKNSIIICFYV